MRQRENKFLTFIVIILIFASSSAALLIPSLGSGKTTTFSNGKAGTSEEIDEKTQNTPPPTPSLIYPHNSASFAPSQPTLVCEQVEDPDGDDLYYVFQLDDNSDFSSPVFTKDAGMNDTSFVIGSDNDVTLSNGKTYHWRVYARDGGSASSWSSVRTLTVDTSVKIFDDVRVGVSDETYENYTHYEDLVWDTFNYTNKIYDKNDLKIWYNVSEIYTYSQDSWSELFEETPHSDDLLVLFNQNGSFGGYMGDRYYAIGHNWNPLTDSGAYDAFVHETGHYRGIPDFYLWEVEPSNNGVASVGHQPSTNNVRIMDYPYGVDTFSKYSKNVISKMGADSRIYDTYPEHINRYFVPDKNYIKVTDKSGNPISGAEIYVYNNTAYRDLDGNFIHESSIKDTVDSSGTTNGSGLYEFAERKYGLLDLEFDISFIKVRYDGTTHHTWLEGNDTQALYWGYENKPIQLLEGTDFDIYYTARENIVPDSPSGGSPSGGEELGETSSVTLSVDVSDVENDAMDVSFYNADTGDLIANDTGVASGNKASVVWNGLTLGKSYSWYAVANDGFDTNKSITWSFNINAAPEKPSNPYPSDGASEVKPSLTLEVDLFDTDQDQMTVSFYNASNGDRIAQRTGVSDGETVSVSWDVAYGTTYHWYVEVSDGTDTTTSSTWSFTTERKYVTRDIELRPGWNFVSSSVIADGNNYQRSNDLVEILDDPEYGVAGHYDKVMYYERKSENWKSYIPNRNSRFDDLSTWDRTMGLWIHMTQLDTLSIEGTAPRSTTIQLEAGWNMVGYPSSVKRRARDTLPSEVTKIGVFNSSMESNIQYIHDLNDHYMKEGRGYWVYNSGDVSVDWTISYTLQFDN